MMQRGVHGVFLAMGALAMAAWPCWAEIRIDVATVSNGRLVVGGTTTTGSSVVLDGSFQTTVAPGDRSFLFSLTYLPEDCIVDLTLTDAPDTQQAVIGQCAPKGTAGPRGGGSSGSTSTTGVDIPDPTTLQDFHTLCSTTLTTSGGPVLAMGTASILYDPDAPGLPISVATGIFQDDVYQVENLNADDLVSARIISPTRSGYFAPSAGTHVYALRARKGTSNAGAMKGFQCRITAIELGAP